MITKKAIVNTTKMQNIIDIETEEKTKNFAKQFAIQLKKGDIILLYGTLGIGKTFFTRSLIQSLINKDIDVPSPTFTILQNYESPKGTISHYDLYRIESPDELYELDFDNSLNNNITIIEWPEIIEDYITEHYNPIKLHFEYKNNKRIITKI
ncbi:MAG: tRNA (adenosine(37)-N6)-threonylcarbamoyltransferase complex ATPase subunit type 1 TsaE [Alphaproteobacteria bacterium]